jgi:hypothetical protein
LFIQQKMALKLFNTKIQNKRFDFMPRYYDERKERLELKRKQFQENENLTENERVTAMREQLKENWSHGKVRQQANYQANFRILILIGVIVVLGYFIFNGLDDIEQVIHKIMK